MTADQDKIEKCIKAAMKAAMAEAALMRAAFSPASSPVDIAKLAKDAACARLDYHRAITPDPKPGTDQIKIELAPDRFTDTLRAESPRIADAIFGDRVKVVQ